MATVALATTSPTLIDWAKSLDPDGTVARQINLLAQTNEILQDMTFIEGNLPTGHRITMLTGLPAVTWRLLNGGVLPSKARTAQIDEQSGMLEAYSKVDVDLAKLNGNISAFRAAQVRPFQESMNQTMASTLFYGSAITPESFIGLAPRYSSLSAGNGSNIIDAGGVQSDNASIWLTAWDPETFTGIFPRGSTQGLFHEDLGQVTDQNTAGVSGALSQVFMEHWQWKLGIALPDWRYVVRIANIDISNLTGNSTPASIIDLMEHALMMLPSAMGRKVFYLNRTMARFLRSQARAEVVAGGGLTYENFDGKPILTFGGVPVRIVDALLNTEARVV